MDGSALLHDVALAAADACASLPARYRFELLVGNGVAAELGRAHEGGGCALVHVQHAAVHNLVDQVAGSG